MTDQLSDFEIKSSTSWTAKCPKCGVTFFRATLYAIEAACLDHPCPPPVAEPAP